MWAHRYYQGLFFWWFGDGLLNMYCDRILLTLSLVIRPLHCSSRVFSLGSKRGETFREKFSKQFTELNVLFWWRKYRTIYKKSEINLLDDDDDLLWLGHRPLGGHDGDRGIQKALYSLAQSDSGTHSWLNIILLRSVTTETPTFWKKGLKHFHNSQKRLNKVQLSEAI